MQAGDRRFGDKLNNLKNSGQDKCYNNIVNGIVANLDSHDVITSVPCLGNESSLVTAQWQKCEPKAGGSLFIYKLFIRIPGWCRRICKCTSRT